MYMKYFLSFVILFCICLNTNSVQAQETEWPELDKSPMQLSYYPANVAWRNYLRGDDRNKRPQVRVSYSSPAKNGRQIFGSLVPYGAEWRLGANEATEIIFYQDVEVGGSVLERGIYTVSATVNQDHWVVHFSTERHIWGNENRDQSKTAASFKVMTNTVKEPRENLAIGFKEIDKNMTHMIIEWDDTNVAIPIAFNVTSFPDVDKSPGDMVHYPDNSRFTNYLKPEELAAAKPKISLHYGRPQMKGRKVFGELLKFGEVWRLGANESTEINFYQDVMLDNIELKAGRYNVYAIVNPTEWTIIFNTDMPAWGAANRDEEKDVAKITVPVTTDKTALEALSMRFKEVNQKLVHLEIGWEMSRVAIPIGLK